MTLEQRLNAFALQVGADVKIDRAAVGISQTRVELVVSRFGTRAIRLTDGFAAYDANFQINIGVSVVPGQTIYLTCRLGGTAVNATGLAGYATRNAKSFVSTAGADGLPIGNLWSMQRWNLINGTNISGRTTFTEIPIVIPAGVYWIIGSSAIQDGVAISIKTDSDSVKTKLDALEATKLKRTELDALFRSDADIMDRTLFNRGFLWDYATSPPTGAPKANATRAGLGYQVIEPETDYIITGTSTFLAFFDENHIVIEYYQSATDSGMDADRVVNRSAATSNYNVNGWAFTSPKGAKYLTGNNSTTFTVNTDDGFAAWSLACRLMAKPKKATLNPALLPISYNKTSDQLVTFYTGQRLDLKPRAGLYRKKLFSITTGNQQGLAYNRGRIFLGYDIGSGNSRLEVWDLYTGLLLKTVASIATAHAAEMKYNPLNSLLYVANGGGTNPTHVFAIDIESAAPAIQRDYDLTALGNSALLGLDWLNNIIWVSSTLTGGDTGDPTFSAVDITTGLVIDGSQFTLPYMGTPNGLAFNNGKLLYCVGNTSTSINIINPATHLVENTITIPNTAEPEGFDVVDDEAQPYFVLGYRSDGVYQIKLL
jgi:hypothetical protein